MVTLVLCDDGDVSAAWAAHGLRLRGLDVVVATASELVCALRCEHQVEDHHVTVDMSLPGRRHWSGRSVTGVLNRLRTVPVPATPGVSEPDLVYARDELQALTLSWLAGLERSGAVFVGRPQAAGLSAPWRYATEWHQLARAAGLPAAAVILDTGVDSVPVAPASSVLCICGELFGTRTPHREAGVRRLLQLTGVETLAVMFDAHGRTVACDELPDLRGGGELGVDALARRLSTPSEEVPR